MKTTFTMPVRAKLGRKNPVQCKPGSNELDNQREKVQGVKFQVIPSEIPSEVFINIGIGHRTFRTRRYFKNARLLKN